MNPGRSIACPGLFLLIFCLLASAWGQAEMDTPPPVTSDQDSPDNLRVMFDNRGGFKLFRLSQSDSTYQPLLNPAIEYPVSLELWKNGSALPIRLADENPGPQDGDPGTRGPALVADDIGIQLWGLDLPASDSAWSAIRYEFTNNGKSITNLSIRFILDTFLGESGREPLTLRGLSDGKKTVISDETQIKTDDQVRVIASTRPDSLEGLYLLLPAKKWPHQLPQRMIAANVRRLQNSGIAFEVEEHRAFNLLPFSINDSALALIHDSEVILPRQRIAIDIIVAPRLDIDPTHIDAVKNQLDAIKLTKLAEASAAPASGTAPLSENRNQLIQRINRMLDTLNAMMATQDYKQGEIEKLVQAIDDAQKQLEAKP
jgi:hypothetical protein